MDFNFNIPRLNLLKKENAINLTDEEWEQFVHYINYDAVTLDEAYADYKKVNLIMELIQNNRLACTITVANESIGVCDNTKLMPALQYHKQELEKFFHCEPNEWE